MNYKDYFDRYNVSYKEDSKNFRIKCPDKNHDDTHPSCDVSKETGIWHCWSCKSKGNFTQLLRLLTGKSIDTTIDYKSKIKNLRNNITKNRDILIYRADIGYKRLMGKNKFSRYLNKRHIDRKLIERYGIGYSDEGYSKNRVIFPIHVGNSLQGFSMRSILSKNQRIMRYTKNDRRRSKYLFSKGFSINSALYNIDNIGEYKTIYLVEGVLDALRMVGLGYVNTISSFTNKLSIGQIELLKECGVDVIAVMYDNDKAGREGTKEAIKLLLDNKFKVYRVRLKYHKDPSSSTLKEIVDAISTKKRIIRKGR